MRSKGERWRAAVEWGVRTCLHAVRVLFTDFLLCARTREEGEGVWELFLRGGGQNRVHSEDYNHGDATVTRS